ncbi:MAG: FAD-binding protein [Alphaproteobacteria bacterium]|nr:FAD-binding protein [Alphaproteobacteria bacterium]
MAIAPDILDRFKALAGPGGFAEDPETLAPYLIEWRERFRGRTPLLLRPRTKEDVAAILKLASETQTPIVPQGGNTGLVGGQIPDGEILVSLTRMRRILSVDPENNTMNLEAGVVLADAQAAAEAADRLFPLSLASEGSATIGGLLSTNAGGTNVVRYGNARDLVLGLSVVLADGRVLDLMRGLRKDNTGYDLKQLFLGAEGTLGLITEAVVKLFPRPRTVEVALVGLDDVASALALYHRVQEASGGAVSGFEVMPRIGLQFVLAHQAGTRAPFDPLPPWTALIEISSPARDPHLRGALESALADAIEAGGAVTAVLAESARDRAAFWALRDGLSEAQKYEGGSIKHDVSVPLSQIAPFIEEASRAVEAACPGIRVVAFGHLGDGNVHFNLSQPPGADRDVFLARWQEMNDIVHGIAHRRGGSISAEHGLGQMKRHEITRYKSATEMDVMRALKRTLDPHGILNPGKVV